MLQRLWDVLRFIVITAAISFGILNSQRKHLERADSWKEDEHRYFRAPFMDAMFDQTQPPRRKEASDSSEESIRTFHLREARSRELGTVPENDRRRGSIARLEKAKRSAEAPIEREFQAKRLIASNRDSDTRVSTLESGANISMHEAPMFLESDETIPGEKHAVGFTVHSHELMNAVSDPRSVSVYKDDATIDRRREDDNSIPLKRSSSLDRPVQQRSARTSHVNRPIQQQLERSSSLERPIQQQSTRSSSVERPIQQHSARSSLLNSPNPQQSAKVSNADVQASKSDPIVKMQREAKAGVDDARNKGVVSKLATSSRHSRSALNLNRFDDSGKIAKSLRRSSYDFGDDYSPEWLYEDELPPPPPPPAAESSSDSETEGEGAPALRKNASVPLHSKDFSQSLVPWRSLPVDIAPKANASTAQLPPVASVEEASVTISPSPGELNRKADAFIARFHEQQRMQRLESAERQRRWLQRGG